MTEVRGQGLAMVLSMIQLILSIKFPAPNFTCLGVHYSKFKGIFLGCFSTGLNLKAKNLKIFLAEPSALE